MLYIYRTRCQWLHAPNGTWCGAQPLLPDRSQLRLAWASCLRSVLTDKAYQDRFVRQVQALASRPPVSRSARPSN